MRFLTAAMHRHGASEAITIGGRGADAAAMRGDNEAPGTAGSQDVESGTHEHRSTYL
jgi:hypothetical protein